MSTWHMLFKNVTTVLKRYCILWLRVKEDSGIFLSAVLFQKVSFLFQNLECWRWWLSKFKRIFLCGRVERIYREINNSMCEGSLVLTLNLSRLPAILRKFTALTGLLVFSLTIYLVVKIMHSLRLLFNHLGIHFLW